MELSKCCGKNTKPISKVDYCNASNTQSQESQCGICGKRYYNWLQDDPAGNSSGSEGIKLEKIKWEKPTLVDLGSVFTDGIVVVANCYYGDNTDKPDSDCHNGMGALTEWGRMVR